MLLFVLLSNFYGNKVQDIQIENYPTKIFLKKTEILFAFSNKDVPLHPVSKKLIAAIAQLVEQRIRNA